VLAFVCILEDFKYRRHNGLYYVKRVVKNNETGISDHKYAKGQKSGMEGWAVVSRALPGKIC